MIHVTIRPLSVREEVNLYLKAHGAHMSQEERARYRSLRSSREGANASEYGRLRKRSRKYRKLVNKARRQFEARHPDKTTPKRARNLLIWQVTRGPDRRADWTYYGIRYFNPMKDRLLLEKRREVDWYKRVIQDRQRKGNPRPCSSAGRAADL